MRVIENMDNLLSLGSVLNIGNNKPTQILQLAKIVLDETDKTNIPIIYTPYQNIFPNRRDVRWRVPDVLQLEELIGPIRWPEIRGIVQNVVTDMVDSFQ